MAFTKLITPGSQDFSEPVAQLVKVSSRGLRGGDMQAFVKRASVQFLDKIASIVVKPGEELVHLIALGCTEAYGCFIAGTEVRQEDGGMAPIEQLRKGERVVDRQGQAGEISHCYSRSYDGEGIRLTVAGMLDPLVCTEGHGFCIIPAAQVACLIDKSKHCKPDTCQ